MRYGCVVVIVVVVVVVIGFIDNGDKGSSA